MRTRIFFIILLILGGLSLLSTLALAQPSGGSYTLTKSTIDGGGGLSAGGAYTLNGTVGQPDASLQVHTGGPYQLRGGFWGRLTDLIFKDSFETD
jgi:hypothetical protein